MQVPHALPGATWEAAEDFISGDKSPSWLRTWRDKR
jgi:hypothetical protein